MNTSRVTLADINRADVTRFAELLGGVFEHSPWVAMRAFGVRSFATFATCDALHAAMMTAVMAATRDEQLALIRAHPELAGHEAMEGAMTTDSTSEQGRLGLTALPRAEFDRITRANFAYREKFGFPCIVALKLHQSRDTVLAEMEQRLQNDRDAEIANALTQIKHITGARLEKLITN